MSFDLPLSQEILLWIAAGIGLAVSLGAYWHSRTNRQALLAHLRGENHRARLMVDRKYRDTYPVRG